MFQLKHEETKIVNGEITNYFEATKPPEERTSRPLKKVYVNFDRENANKMFGYRVKFEKENLAGTGVPPANANQDHKPIRFQTYDLLKDTVERYQKIDGYFERQTIVKLLDSDNEEDLIEIEKNKKIIQHNRKYGISSHLISNNPKIKKKFKNLNWLFDQRSVSPPMSKND